MKKRFRYEITVGLFVIAAAVILGYISLKISRMRVRDGIEVQFIFSDACGLVKDAPVSVSGVEVGYIKSLSLESEKALITARLSSSAGLRRDIKASIRSKSLLGEKFLEIIPGGSDAPLLHDEDLITNTQTPAQIDQLVAWAGRLLEEIDPVNAAQLLNALSKDPEAVRRIVKNTDELLEKLSSLDAKKLKEFTKELRIKARLF